MSEVGGLASPVERCVVCGTEGPEIDMPVCDGCGGRCCPVEGGCYVTFENGSSFHINVWCAGCHEGSPDAP